MKINFAASIFVKILPQSTKSPCNFNKDFEKQIETHLGVLIINSGYRMCCAS